MTQQVPQPGDAVVAVAGRRRHVLARPCFDRGAIKIMVKGKGAGQGREISAHFSPSRCESVLRQISSKRLCVGCLAKRSGLDVPGLEDQNEQGSLADEDEDEDEGLSSRPGKDAPGGKDRKGVGGRQRKRKSKRAQADRFLDGNESTDEEEDDTSSDATVKKGTIKLDASICASADTCPHFACLECEKTIRAAHTQSGSMSCPRCLDLQLRMEHSWDERAPGQRVYCQDIFPFGEDAKMPSGNKAAGGFVCSAKIQQALDWTSNLPPGEKGIIFSFFKGGFDLIEGALEELQIGCARFDGDVPSEARQQELMRFKKDAACRVMLMSVGTGGTGLNITEANHVLFLDRWFNPCVHEQAMDRAHRIGQKRPVDVGFIDVNMSIDQVMAHMNNVKAGNAEVILADGSNLGAAGGSSTPSFKDLSGFLLSAMKGIRAQRIAHFAVDPSVLSQPASLDAGSEFDPFSGGPRCAAAGGSGKAKGSGWKGTGASANPAAAGGGQGAGVGASKAKHDRPQGQDGSAGRFGSKAKSESPEQSPTERLQLLVSVARDRRASDEGGAPGEQNEVILVED